MCSENKKVPVYKELKPREFLRGILSSLLQWGRIKLKKKYIYDIMLNLNGNMFFAKLVAENPPMMTRKDQTKKWYFCFSGPIKI